MQKGSLVRIKHSADMKLIGTFGIVLRDLQHGHIMIKGLMVVEIPTIKQDWS